MERTRYNTFHFHFYFRDLRITVVINGAVGDGVIQQTLCTRPNNFTLLLPLISFLRLIYMFWDAVIDTLCCVRPSNPPILPLAQAKPFERRRKM